MDSTVVPISSTRPHVEGLVLGRAADCDLVISDRTVSRYHAALRHDEDRWIITDLGSKNGTRVNGVCIGAEATINPGDELGLGAAVVRFAPGGRRLIAERAA